jgi:hypothetical protein
MGRGDAYANGWDAGFTAATRTVKAEQDQREVNRRLLSIEAKAIRHTDYICRLEAAIDVLKKSVAKQEDVDILDSKIATLERDLGILWRHVNAHLLGHVDQAQGVKPCTCE